MFVCLLCVLVFLLLRDNDPGIKCATIQQTYDKLHKKPTVYPRGILSSLLMEGLVITLQGY